jgi:hypothetical protein
MSFNFLFNFLSKLISLNNPSILFSSVFSYHGSEQHLDPAIVFSPLSLLSSNLFNSPKIDSTYTDTEFEKLLLHFTYESSSESSFSPNTPTDSLTTLEEFTAFYQLSLHVFSSFFSYYYSLH